MRSFSIPYNNDRFLLDKLFEEFPDSKDLWYAEKYSDNSLSELIEIIKKFV